MHDKFSLKEIQEEWHGNYKSYAIGFICSLVLTVASFLIVILNAFSSSIMTTIIVSFALVQAIIQSFFFLHVGKEPKPQWESLVFAFMLLVLMIIAFGSLWIMYDLNQRVMGDMVMNHD